jgi:MFS superfamily sulfate permease-like transporter
VVIYLLQGNLQFFNVEHVRGRIEEIFANLAPDTKGFVFDAGAVTQIDSTAAVFIDDIRRLAEDRGIKFALVELHSEPLEILQRAGVVDSINPSMIFDDLDDAVNAFSAMSNSPATAKA